MMIYDDVEQFWKYYRCENVSSLHSIGSYVYVHAAGNIFVFEEKCLRPFADPGGAVVDFDIYKYLNK